MHVPVPTSHPEDHMASKDHPARGIRTRRRRRRTAHVATAVLAAVTLVAGCAGSGGDGGSPGGSGQAAGGGFERGMVNAQSDPGDVVRGGTLTFGVQALAPVLDPAKQGAGRGGTGGDAAAAVYDVLMKYD